LISPDLPRLQLADLAGSGKFSAKIMSSGIRHFIGFPSGWERITSRAGFPTAGAAIGTGRSRHFGRGTAIHGTCTADIRDWFQSRQAAPQWH